MKLVLATRNEGKLVELRHLLEGIDVEVSSLAEFPEIGEIVEDGQSFRENALIKARAVVAATGTWTLADDSGLVVDALGGQPGIHSARYAGRQGDHAANNEKLLQEMRDVPDERRQAAFVCTMALISPEHREWVVEGRCEGMIARERSGTEGFGFDPLFFVGSCGATMAELPLAQKNGISHRGQALRKMKAILIEIMGHAKERENGSLGV